MAARSLGGAVCADVPPPRALLARTLHLLHFLFVSFSLSDTSGRFQEQDSTYSSEAGSSAMERPARHATVGSVHRPSLHCLRRDIFLRAQERLLWSFISELIRRERLLRKGGTPPPGVPLGVYRGLTVGHVHSVQGGGLLGNPSHMGFPNRLTCCFATIDLFCLRAG